MADITIHLMKSKNAVPTVEGLSLTLNQNQFYIVAGEENATTFEIEYPSDYAGYDFFVKMVNAAGYGISRTKLENNSEADWVISDKEFYLPLGMAVAGYSQISITAEDGNKTSVVFMPIKVPVQNTIPDWKYGIDEDASVYISNGNLYYTHDEMTKNLGTVVGRGFTARGNWSSSETYTASDTNVDVVLYGGVSYYCKVTNTNKSPSTETSYWGVFAESSGVEIIRL